MTKRKWTKREILETVAWQLADKWRDFPERVLYGLEEELSLRVPGFSKEEYGKAISEALLYTRK